ncbi:hypothetical protein DQW77_01665 [Roseovarius sp. TE539]|uniref:DUF2852 domain-containing protein n=1 Tax=Roseovarius sp. TE539 TaxID=2249812 RepID=UPI000DDE10CC|nr:DUF2852 domain-containing protein [Roseovarius sp. TE539]RBI77169.1 hypothetical protein DQW77_01665 [Roseovarius sp. TE539]
MTTLARNSDACGPLGWLGRAEGWLDEKGKGAWIAAMVIAFVLVWPVGLALLFYMIWSNKMPCKSRRNRRDAVPMTGTTGNTAFDNYRAETLRRLEEERESFESFLHRLREAKDKAEFDQFMDERARAAADTPTDRANV